MLPKKYLIECLVWCMRPIYELQMIDSGIPSNPVILINYSGKIHLEEKFTSLIYALPHP